MQIKYYTAYDFTTMSFEVLYLKTSFYSTWGEFDMSNSIFSFATNVGKTFMNAKSLDRLFLSTLIFVKTF